MVALGMRTKDGRSDPDPTSVFSIGMEEAEGQPSRWNTLRVLDWYSTRRA